MSLPVGCSSFQNLLETFQICRGMLGEILSAFEFLDASCMSLVEKHLELTNPIAGTRKTPTCTMFFCLNPNFGSQSDIKLSGTVFRTNSYFPESPFYIIIETAGSNTAHDEEKLHIFLGKVMASSLVADGTVATEETKIKVVDW